MNKIAKEIYYITNVRLPTHRAHGLQIMKSCEAFAANGAKVELVIPNLKPTYPSDPFDYYSVNRDFSIRRAPVFEVVPLEKWLGHWMGYVQNISFSLSAIIYALTRGWPWMGGIFYTRDYMTAWFMAILNLNPVFELHDYRSKKPLWRIGFILRKARKIIVNSEGTLKALRGHYPIDKNKIIIVPNGVDLEFFDIPQSQEEIRTKIDIPSNSMVIAYIGSLETVGLEKGVGTLIRAFASIYEDYPKALLMIVGGPSHLVVDYERIARGENIPNNRVRFTGQVMYKDIPMYLRATDIAVIPLPKNRHGLTTSPIKLFEYMAAGKTILASDLPSLRKYIDSQNAELFLSEDSHDLAGHIRVLLDDPIHAKYLADNALKEASTYTWSSRAAQIINSLYA